MVRAHSAPDRQPLVLQPGDAVRLEERSDPEALTASELWPAFAWVSSGDRHGWVPKRFLELDANGRGIARRRYDTTELSAEPDETIEVLEDDAESGWLWGRAIDGREGWMPWNAVEPL